MRIAQERLVRTSTAFGIPRLNDLAGFNEFAGLWRYIKDWYVYLVYHTQEGIHYNSRQDVFRHFDKDRSGTIEGQELKAALSQFGYNLNPQLLQLLERKYGECL